jgi:hypothetical protein
VTELSRLLELPPPGGQLPPALAWALCYAMEVASKLARSSTPPRLNVTRMKFLYYNQHYSIEKARRELGYTPRFTYREGLPQSLEWLGRPSLLSQREAVTTGGERE